MLGSKINDANRNSFQLPRDLFSRLKSCQSVCLSFPLNLLIFPLCFLLKIVPFVHKDFAEFLGKKPINFRASFFSVKNSGRSKSNDSFYL